MPNFQVFEHETIMVGDTCKGVKFDQRHFMCLSERLGKKDDTVFPFYSLVKYKHTDGIKFKQYVGAIQAKDLTIEILPKTDRKGEKKNWKEILLFMLSRVRKLSIKSPGSSSQHIQKSSILDFILLRFLDETEELIHKGLVKTYQAKDENLYSLKGKLIVSTHIRNNIAHKERFFVRHTVYNQSHIMNRIIRQTLLCIAESSTNSAVRQRVRNSLQFFPELDSVVVNESLFANLDYNRKTEEYREAMSLSELILFNNMPDLSSGRKDSLAMLFDMNRLWEEFIYVTLRRYLPADYDVTAQERKKFWENRIIKPDIVIRHGDELIILDTKWKQPEKMTPSDSDLHQMYVYYKYFGAKKVALLYPSSDNTHPIRQGTFSEDSDGTKASCDLMLLPVPRWKGRGKMWQEEIAQAIQSWIEPQER